LRLGPWVFAGFWCLAVLPATAGPIVIPGEDDAGAIHFDVSRLESNDSSALQPLDPKFGDTPITGLVEAKLGAADGWVEVFRYHVDGVPGTITDLRTPPAGGGLKLKITW